jgi:hypothetical protein
MISRITSCANCHFAADPSAVRDLPDKACQSAPILIGMVEEIVTIFCVNTFRKEHRRPGFADCALREVKNRLNNRRAR